MESNSFLLVESTIHILSFLLLLIFLFLTLTLTQICDLPPGTISDITNEHNLTVHWTEKHTHRDCALYTGDTYRASSHAIFRDWITSVYSHKLITLNF